MAFLANDVEAGNGLATGTIDLAAIVAELKTVRERWRAAQQRSTEAGGHELPSTAVLTRVLDALRGALFPLRLGPPELRQENEDYYVGHTLGSALVELLGQVRRELRYRTRTNGSAGADAAQIEARALALVREFGAQLPQIRALLDTDVLAAYRGDPAAHCVDEVLLCYPGVHAVIHHRIAHALYRLGVPMLARMVAEIAHGQTGIDIHPGARIGPGFFIDHGTGVVIGETAVIGANVRLYQAVTLGARRFAADADGQLERGGARHPIVEDDVVIYAGATILGRVTIGRGTAIGGNVWLTRSVPPYSQVTQAQSREGGRDEAFSSGSGI